MAWAGDDKAWWERRGTLFALVLLSAVPLLWPQIPPLTDVPGHIGRYRVELGIDHSLFLSHYYAFRWLPIGNLGVDLLVVPLAPLLGLEGAVKAIVIAIPMLSVAGMLFAAREAHGRVPPTVLFALPLAYCFPFQFGFVNFTLSMALALLGYGLWLRMGRKGWKRPRALVFVVLSAAIWFAHIVGWGVLGLLVFAAEFMPVRQGRYPWWPSLWRPVRAVLPLTPPILLMLLWRTDTGLGDTGHWFEFGQKFDWLAMILRERWEWFDIASAAMLILLLAAGAAVRRLNYEPKLAIGAALLLIAFGLLPRLLFGSNYADMRLAPYAVATGLLSLRPMWVGGEVKRNLALAGLAFMLARTAATTVDFIQLDALHRRQLEAVEHIAPGSRVLALANGPCQRSWANRRMDHLDSMALVRRDAFVNGQFALAGSQLLRVIYPGAGKWRVDPSQLLRPGRCRSRGEPDLADTIAHFPRQGFDYLWLIDTPRAWEPRRSDLQPVWRGDTGALFRVVS